MTLPDERYAAIRNTERFLMNLCDARVTPRVPRYLRDQARSLLRHYPSTMYLDRLAERSPNIIAPRIEELTRMLMVYEQSREEKHDDHAS
jgi:hypothetical protein